MRVAVCDDIPEQIRIIVDALAACMAQFKDVDLEVDEFLNGFELLDRIDKGVQYDLVLLDICMPGILGTDVARELRRRKVQAEIIFLTTSDEFAVDAFAVNAAHYLLKPFSQKSFNEAMNRAMEKIDFDSAKTISVKLTGGGLRMLGIDEILYIECQAHEQYVYLQSGECVELKLSMLQLQTELDNTAKNQFVSPYKGYILNLKAVRTIQPNEIILRNNKTVPLAKRSFAEVKEKYFNFMFKSGGSSWKT